MLTKLYFCGIQGITAKWFRFYLKNEKRKVKIKSPNEMQNFFSNWARVKHGLPGGLILGLLLFMMYINDPSPTIKATSEQTHNIC
jgi:hypothetical protein